MLQLCFFCTVSCIRLVPISRMPQDHQALSTEGTGKGNETKFLLYTQQFVLGWRLNKCGSRCVVFLTCLRVPLVRQSFTMAYIGTVTTEDKAIAQPREYAQSGYT